MKRHSALALALAGIALVSLLSACSDDNKGTVPGLPDGATLPGGVTVPDGVTVPAGNTDMGFCHVKVEGDITAEWTSAGGASSVGYGPWVPSTTGTIAGISLDDSFFILNCQGEGDDYVGFMPLADTRIPMQPATYTIEAAANAFGASEGGLMSTLLGFEGSGTNWGPSARGQLVITEFDANHIAGTFTIPVTDVLAQMTGTSEGDAVITGEFNYSNPN